MQFLTVPTPPMLGGLILVSSWLPAIPAQAQSNGICAANLPAQVDRVINQPDFAEARWGVLVQELNRLPNLRKTLVDRDGQKLFIPASNAKLLTTAAALKQLGAGYRIRTSILGTPLGDGVWNIQVIGRGDPSLKDLQLKDLVKQLRQRGVKRISQLMLDDRYFGDDLVNSSWDWGDLQSGYGAIANSLMVNLNYHSLTLTPTNVGQPLALGWSDRNAIAGLTIDNQTRTVAQTAPEFIRISRGLGQQVLRIRGQLRQGAEPDVRDLAVLNPTEVFRDRFRTALSEAGITTGAIRFAAATTTNLQQEIASVESPPISELIKATNTESDNLYAEAILQTIAATNSDQTRFEITAADSQTTVGLKILKSTLASIGINPQGYRLFDGAGLARMNLASPQTFVETLQAMNYHTSGNPFRASLPIAAQTGTLTNRFRHTAAAGIVQAKTGTLTSALSLSGYISPKNYKPLAFSILLNQSTRSNAEQRRAIDAIVLLLAQLKNCE